MKIEERARLMMLLSPPMGAGEWDYRSLHNAAVSSRRRVWRGGWSVLMRTDEALSLRGRGGGGDVDVRWTMARSPASTGNYAPPAAAVKRWWRRIIGDLRAGSSRRRARSRTALADVPYNQTATPGTARSVIGAS